MRLFFLINKITLISLLIHFLCNSVLFAGAVTNSYDLLNRLVETVITDSSKTTTITYKYDAAGNMTSFVTESETPATIQSFSADYGRTDCNTGCAGDLDEDGDVDGSDLSLFIGM